MAISFKGAHFPQEIILMGVRWYLAYPLSYRHVEELMEERGVPVDHATIQPGSFSFRRGSCTTGPKPVKGFCSTWGPACLARPA